MIGVNRRILVKFIAVFVSLVGIAVIIGWIFDVGVLKSILPSWVTMKFTTAVSFFLCGMILYNIPAIKNDGASYLFIAASALVLLLIMITLLFSALTGMNAGLEKIFVRETAGAVSTTVPGRPSVPTMISFILMGVAGLMAIQEPKNLEPILRTIGGTMAVIGGIAVIGYIVNLPPLYYLVEGVNTAMALHTAILFVLLGAGLILAGGE